MRIAVVVLVSACSVGSYGDTPATDGKAIDTPLTGARVEILATATPAGGAGGTYTPRNIDAIWVEGPAGFVKTIGRWAAERKIHLVAWNTAAGAGDADAVSGATRMDYNSALQVAWDLKDRQGQVVPDGMYTIRMESADDNSTSPAQNNQGTFTFMKSATAQSQTALANGGFTNVSITFTP